MRETKGSKRPEEEPDDVIQKILSYPRYQVWGVTDLSSDFRIFHWIYQLFSLFMFSCICPFNLKFNLKFKPRAEMGSNA